MELTFLGRGAGFNPAEGSTAAYFFERDKLFLIDAGESVFRILRERKILERAAEVNLFISHTHSDHTGSLGSLVLYVFIVLKQRVNIIIDDNVSYAAGIRALLKIFGITEKMYCFRDTSVFDNACDSFIKVRYVKTRHCDELASCGLLFETAEGLVFYSGDMNNTDPLAEIIKSGRAVGKVYIDSNDTEPNMHHVSIHALNRIVPAELKPKIHCMHLNSSQCIAEAKAYGFTVVE